MAPFHPIFTRAALPMLICIASLSGCFHEPVVPDDLYVRVVDGETFDTTPVRGEFRPLRNRRTGFEYRCSECHTDFQNPTRETAMQGEHKDIYDAFDHGLNTRCINCHHQEDRNAYVDHDGAAIPASNPARLCAKCHGPIYRDWQRGIHGRQNGHWNADFGVRKKLLCVQCHDPHKPGFPMMKPDPAPQYTRLQDKPPHDVSHEREVHSE